VKFFRNVSLELSIQSLWFSICLLDQHIVQLATKDRKTFLYKDCIQTQRNLKRVLQLQNVVVSFKVKNLSLIVTVGYNKEKCMGQ